MAGLFGDVPGVPAGNSFTSRREAADAGVHRPLQAGISGGSQTGAESIVVPGGYEDDEDHGETDHLHRPSSGAPLKQRVLGQRVQSFDESIHKVQGEQALTERTKSYEP
jgi:putative restriction endonuclease